MILNAATARRLIETIHCAALDPSRWQDFVDELHRATEESPIALHKLYSDNGQIVTSAASGFDPGFVTTYVEHYSVLSPWIDCFRVYPERRALMVSEMGLPADYERGAFYNEWVLPQDIRYGASIRTRGVGSRALITGISTRARDRDRMEPASQRLLTWLEPHLAHALAVNEEIARLSANSMLKPTDISMPSPSAGGVLIVTTQRLLCWADAGAISLFGKVVRVAPSGRLGFVDALIQTWFEVLTDFFDVPDRSARGLGLEIEMRLGQQIWTIRALQCDDQTAATVSFPDLMMNMRHPGGRALALVIAPRETDHGPSGFLRRRFRLSEAEADVALCVADGLDTEEIANLRQVSRNTIRNQIQSVLTKLGARNRGDVVRIVSQFPRKG